MEHHSSLLPWRDLGEVDEVVEVPEDEFGRTDIQWLEERLAKIRADERDAGAKEFPRL